ncbi:hypothetical protein STXM2123_5949 [Streptomyces sp. F-3]|nr:hypothetical protein STXM2123_5949 [Streptomyces sp. F-3]
MPGYRPVPTLILPCRVGGMSGSGGLASLVSRRAAHQAPRPAETASTGVLSGLGPGMFRGAYADLVTRAGFAPARDVCERPPRTCPARELDTEGGEAAEAARSGHMAAACRTPVNAGGTRTSGPVCRVPVDGHPP